MDILNSLFAFVITIMNNLLPALGVPESFFIYCDAAFATLITIFQTASFFVPLDILVACLSVMLVVDNFSLIMRVGQFILKLVRG